MLALSLPLIFAACASPPPPSQMFNFTSLSSGLLRLAQNQSLCVVPAVCGALAATPAVAAPCDGPCSKWSYDTFTYFTFTNDKTGLLLEAAGAGAPAAVAPATGLPAQQFQYSPDTLTVTSAADSTLCLAAAPPTAWPALAGADTAAAAAAIAAAVPATTRVERVDDGAPVTMDFREDRVRIFVRGGRVVGTPAVG